MAYRSKKIFVKLVYTLPVQFVILFLTKFWLGYPFWLIIVGSVVVSCVFVFSNKFDYDYYNDMDDSDYFESSHNVSFPYSENTWRILNDLNLLEKFNYRLIEKNEVSIKYEIDFLFSRSDLHCIRVGNDIDLKIEKKFLRFIPDKAKNYKELRKILKQLDRIEGNGEPSVEI